MEMRGESQLLVTEGGGKPKEDAEEESQQLVSPYGDGISISSKDAGKLLGADGGGIFLTARHAERLGADGNGNNTDGNSVLKDAGLEESEQLLGPADTSQRAEELQQLLGPNVDGDGKPAKKPHELGRRCHDRGAFLQACREWWWLLARRSGQALHPHSWHAEAHLLPVRCCAGVRRLGLGGSNRLCAIRLNI